MLGFVKSDSGVLVSIGLTFAAADVSAMGGGGQSSGGSTQSVDAHAVGKVKASDYQGSITLLKRVVAADPKNADALNYLGSSYRKSNDLRSAMTCYQKSFAIDPNHKGDDEYPGELYVRPGDLRKARKKLAKLDNLCSFECTEYKDLKAKIAALGKMRGS